MQYRIIGNGKHFRVQFSEGGNLYFGLRGNAFYGWMHEDTIFNSVEEAEEAIKEYMLPVAVVKEFDNTKPEGALSLV